MICLFVFLCGFTKPSPRVLVYTKNGPGYVHDNIPAAVACFQGLGKAHAIQVDVSDDPAVFAEANLAKYQTLIFTSTNNDVFATDAQRLAFRHYIEAGGGFVGVHSVTGTERNWSQRKFTCSPRKQFQSNEETHFDDILTALLSSPVVSPDDQLLYISGTSTTFYCLDAQTGGLLWSDSQGSSGYFMEPKISETSAGNVVYIIEVNAYCFVYRNVFSM